MPPTVLPPISIKAEDIFAIPLPWGTFTVTNSMFQTLLVVLGITIFAILATRKMSLVPKGAQNLAEAIVELLLGITEGTAGKRVGRRIFPLIATLFIFILIANYSGLLPGVGTIGECVRPATAEVAAAAACRPPVLRVIVVLQIPSSCRSSVLLART